MVCCNDIPSVVNYGSSAVYKELPTPEQVASGVIPLDSLPAAWWNALWACNNIAFNCARTYVGQLISELNTVLTQAGITANCTCVDQLYQAITNLRRIVGDADYPGAVKSSSCPGEVSINEYGVMTANCLGNAANLTTTSKNVVGAINELKSTYDDCFTAIGNAGYTTLGNTNGCALGTAAAGTASTAARSDHVHPYPTYVECLRDATNSSCYSRMNYGAAGLTNPVWMAGWNGYELRAVCRATLCVGCAGANGSGCAFGAAATRGVKTLTAAGHTNYDTCGTYVPDMNFLSFWNGAYNALGASNLRYYCGGAFGTAAACAASAFRSCTWTPSCVACAGAIKRTGYANAYDFDVALTNNSTTSEGTTFYVSNACRLKFCNTTGNLTAKCFSGALLGCACCAGRDGSGCSFGTAARYACGCFRPSTWTPSCVACSSCTTLDVHGVSICIKCMCNPFSGSYIHHICARNSSGAAKALAVLGTTSLSVDETTAAGYVINHVISGSTWVCMGCMSCSCCIDQVFDIPAIQLFS